MLECGCANLGYKESFDWDELTQLMRRRGTCASPWFVCANIDRLLRAADAERTRKNYYNKKKKREGYSEAEIKHGEQRRRTVRVGKVVDLDAVL